MFNKGSKSDILNADKVDTIIGHSTAIEGTIKAEGSVRINGNLTGELIVKGNVIIGDTSNIKGNIKAENVYIAGTVHGNVTASGQLHITSTAKLVGDVDVKNIVIDEGAVFNGHCKTVTEEAPGKEKDKNKIA